MDAKLVVVGGKASKRQVSLKLPTVIGRSRDADLTVAHPMVSRQHCELYDLNGLLRVRDLGSLNGTFVANQRIQEADLYPGDEFCVGPLTFRVKYEYVGEIASAPQIIPALEPSEPVEVEPLQEIPQGSREGHVPSEEVVPVAQPADVVPLEGELPDFAAWGAVDESEADQPDEPPAPPPFESPAPSERGTAAETGEGQEPGIPLPPEESPLAEVVPLESIASADSPDPQNAEYVTPLDADDPVAKAALVEPEEARDTASWDEIQARAAEASVEPAESSSAEDAPPAAEEEAEKADSEEPSDDDELNKFLKGF